MTILESVQAAGRNTLIEHLGIRFEVAEPNRMVAVMPVEPRTHQPAGYLHGGANVALAETLASTGGFLNIDPARQSVFGLEINANHIRGKRTGFVRGEATLLHKGRSTMVWQIFIRDEAGNLISVCRCTLAILDRPTG